MRLLFLYPCDLPAPVAAPIQILRTARALAERGVEVTTAWGRVDRPAEVLERVGLDPHPGLRLVPFYDRRRRRRPGGALRRLAAGHDVVIGRGEGGVLAFGALRGTRPFVYEAHRPVESAPRVLGALRGPSLASLEARTVRGAAGLMGISRGVLDELRRRHGGNQSELVLPSGTEPPPVDAVPHRDLDVLYAGKVEERKGLGLILEAMKLLPGADLTIVGGSPDGLATLGPAVARVRAAGAGVNLIGRVLPSEVRGWYRRARVGVCPLPAGVSDVSDRFTSPMKIMDMMACGTPIVATDLPSVREILTDGVNARLVPPNDPAAMASAIRGLLDRPEPALLEQARRDVEAFTWEARAEKLHRFLDGLRG